MDQHTAQQILQYLSEKPDSTVRQISHALRVTPADIRYHLSSLLNQNLVTLSSKTKKGQRGRPARTYVISPNIRPNNILSLAGAALSILLNDPLGSQESSLQRLASLLSPPQPTKPRLLTPKIIQLVSRLNLSGYSARWEARPNGPCIIFTNCPYRQLLSQFPQLCEMDRLILQNHLETKITLEHHIHPNLSTPLTCQFSVSAQQKIKP
jgi:predicted ArsR family transcriptional regulator